MQYLQITAFQGKHPNILIQLVICLTYMEGSVKSGNIYIFVKDSFSLLKKNNLFPNFLRPYILNIFHLYRIEISRVVNFMALIDTYFKNFIEKQDNITDVVIRIRLKEEEKPLRRHTHTHARG